MLAYEGDETGSPARVAGRIVLWDREKSSCMTHCSGRFWVLPKEGHPEGLKGHSRGFCEDRVVLCFSSGVPDTPVCRKVRKGGLETAYRAEQV